MLEPVHPKRFLPTPPSLLSWCRILHLLESNAAKNCSWRAIAIWFLKTIFFFYRENGRAQSLVAQYLGGEGGEALAATGVGGPDAPGICVAGPRGREQGSASFL